MDALAELLRFNADALAPEAVSSFACCDFPRSLPEAVVSAFRSTGSLANRFVPCPLLLACGAGETAELAFLLGFVAAGGWASSMLGGAPELLEAAWRSEAALVL